MSKLGRKKIGLRIDRKGPSNHIFTSLYYTLFLISWKYLLVGIWSVV